MKTIILLFLAAAAWAQPPAVNVTTSISASVGTLTCTGTPGNVAGLSTMHMLCTAGSTTIHTSDSTVPSTPGTSVTVAVSSGVNAIAVLLTKGNAAADQWQVSATDGTTTKFKSGSF